MVESKNGAVIGKHMGYCRSPARRAEEIDGFYVAGLSSRRQDDLVNRASRGEFGGGIARACPASRAAIQDQDDFSKLAGPAQHHPQEH